MHAWLAILSVIVVIAATDPATVDAQQPSPTPASDIESFVRQVYIEGIPYQEVVRFDPATAVPVLLNMLMDPGEEKHRPNIVVTLGMLGDQRAIDPLIEFLQKDGPTPLSHSQYIAKTSVVMALGYIVNKGGSDEALNFLKDGVDPGFWTRRGIEWVSPYHRSEADRNRQLTTMDVLGLGLTGHPSAAATLQSLQEPGATEADKVLRSQIRDAVAEALRANMMISNEGLARYYQRPQTLPPKR